MKANPKQIEAMCGLLNRLYQQIHPLEAEHGILVGEDDLRARVEHFQDAVRALLAQGATHSHKGRLSLDQLAFDVRMLRKIELYPLTPLKGKEGAHAESGKKGASGRALAIIGQQAHGMKKASGRVEGELGDLYKSYGVFFVALFAEPADRDYKSKIDQKDSEVEQLSEVVRQIEGQIKKQGEKLGVDLQAVAGAISDPQLKKKIIQLLQANKQKRNPLATEAIKFLKGIMRESDRAIAAIEKTHMVYLSTQLAMYEQSRDIVKKMAAQGLNIAGAFVQGSMDEAQRGMRGR